MLALLLFPSCKKSENVYTFEAAKRAMDADSAFSRADEDFITTNFDAPKELKDAAVYFSDAGEVGIFSLENAENAKDMHVFRTCLRS